MQGNGKWSWRQNPELDNRGKKLVKKVEMWTSPPLIIYI